MELGPAPLICAPSTATLIRSEHASILGNAGQFAILVQIGAGHLAQHLGGVCRRDQRVVRCYRMAVLHTNHDDFINARCILSGKRQGEGGEGAESGEGKEAGKLRHVVSGQTFLWGAVCIKASFFACDTMSHLLSFSLLLK